LDADDDSDEVLMALQETTQKSVSPLDRPHSEGSRIHMQGNRLHVRRYKTQPAGFLTALADKRRKLEVVWASGYADLTNCRKMTLRGVWANMISRRQSDIEC